MMRRLFLPLFLLIAITAAPAQMQTPVPYTLSFEPVNTPTLPAMHSYCLANVSPTQWFILGGRIMGLHTFNPAGNNFAGPNNGLWSFNPAAATASQIADLSKIAPNFAGPLTATNQQCEYHPDTGMWYIIGGYGRDPVTGNFVTFPTIIRIAVNELVAIAQNPSLSPAQKQIAIATLIANPANIASNPILKVTGGSLSHTASGLEFLSFGQLFDGRYNPFQGGGFTQVYTQAVTAFSITSAPFGVTPIQTYTSPDPSAPFNRRDFSAVYDVDPTTSQERFSIFGGVFPPGKIAAYDYPVYITGAGFNISINPAAGVHQRFGAYEQPVIVVWDGSQVYHTFFGGIGHYFLNQTPNQAIVYKEVTAQGRNDGLPFVEDIATQIEDSTGNYTEWVSTQPIPGGLLRGASVDFEPNLALASRFQGTGGTVLNLRSFQPNEQQTIGYIFGGIQADFPLPCIPSHGTKASGTLYKVVLTYTPWTGLVPSSQATEAVNFFDHTKPGANLTGKNLKSAAGPNPCSSVVKTYAPLVHKKEVSKKTTVKN